MEIREHLLQDPSVSHVTTPNMGGPISPRFLVIHYTAGRSAESSVEWFQSSNAKASAHLVIGRDGRVWQLVPFNLKAWHAGESAWGGLDGLNSHAIGIELDNAGRLERTGQQFRAWFGAVYPPEEVLQARHKLEQSESNWHAFTDRQIAAVTDVAMLLVGAYGLEDILGHDDIAPLRKRDPGPAFPMLSFKSRILGRGDDTPIRYRVSVSLLNLRGGPGPEFSPVRGPLPYGTVTRLVEMRDRWAHVLLLDGTEAEGWVSNKYIERVV